MAIAGKMRKYLNHPNDVIAPNNTKAEPNTLLFKQTILQAKAGSSTPASWNPFALSRHESQAPHGFPFGDGS